MSFKSRIQQNARAIAELHQRIHETYTHRNDNEHSRAIWKVACSEFHKRYDELAFPGGTTGIRERLRSGDKQAIDYALDFLEVRPYFFRSGYMYKDFLRVLRNCPLSEAQRMRYDQLKARARYDEYRKHRNAARID